MTCINSNLKRCILMSINKTACILAYLNDLLSSQNFKEFKKIHLQQLCKNNSTDHFSVKQNHYDWFNVMFTNQKQKAV